MPRWAYHLTYQSDLASISRNGLRVQRDVEEAWDNKPAVYFVGVLGYEAGPAYDPETGAWLRFPWPSDVPVPKDVGASEFRTLKTVPPGEIEVLKRGGEFPNSAERGSKWIKLSKVFAGKTRLGGWSPPWE